MRHWLERWIHSVWYDGAVSGIVLVPLSWLYHLVLLVRAYFFTRGWKARYRSSLPVIVVGNITAGGVGKTPFVIWLVEWLQRKGHKPGVITRGYGGELSDSTFVTTLHSAREVGDEALMMFRRLSVPVVVGRSRSNSAAMLEESGVTIIVTDDGLQHYALERDVEICLVDGQRKFGNGRLLPSGPLREPVNRLESVTTVVNHVAALDDGQSGMALGNPRLRQLTTGQTRELSVFEGKSVHAVAGLGNPERFFTSLERAGLNVVAHPFSDHHDYVSHDVDFADDLPVLMTDKDAVKCEHFARDTFYAVRVDAQVSSDVERSILEAVNSFRVKARN
ncbi:MAG: tetraacyldisaccharide 4'-kinase [Gammaproteobacteria bacterium]